MLAQLTGLEAIQSIIAGKAPQPSMAVTMNMHLKQAEMGAVAMKVMADDRHLNPMGTAHGGFASTVLDTVTSCAVHTTLGVGDRYGTIDLNIKMMRPIPVNQWLRAEGHIISVSKSLGTAEGTLRDENDKIIAHATCSCMIRRA